MAKNSNNTYINTAYLKLLSCFIAFKFESFRLFQLPAQGFEPVGEARLDRAERHAEHRGRLLQRHLVEMIEDDDGAAGRVKIRHSLAQWRRKFRRELVARRRGGDRDERLLVTHLLG